MGGCCCRIKTIKIQKDISANSNIIYNKNCSNTRGPDIQSFPKIEIKNENENKKDKEKKQKEKDNITFENLKTDIDEQKDKSTVLHISPLCHSENIDNKIKGSNRIRETMNKLKLLTLKDIEKNKKFFKLKN